MEAGEQNSVYGQSILRADLATEGIDCEKALLPTFGRLQLLAATGVKVGGSPLRELWRRINLSGCQTLHQTMSVPFGFIPGLD